MNTKGTGSANVWVLDTQTKGTGANMVPLESVLKKGSDSVPGFALPDLKPPPEPEPRKPRRFKIVDVMTRRVLAENADARATLDALRDVRSIVDVTVYIWEPDAERWRMLSFTETRALWDRRAQAPDARKNDRVANVT